MLEESTDDQGKSSQDLIQDPLEVEKRNEEIEAAEVDNLTAVDDSNSIPLEGKKKKLELKKPVLRLRRLRHEDYKALASSDVTVKVEAEEFELLKAGGFGTKEDVDGRSKLRDAGPVTRKRGWPAKSLVGAAKRKAKALCVVKKEVPARNCDLKMEEDKTEDEQPSIFRWECHVCGEVCRNWNCLLVHCRTKHKVAAQVMCICAKILASRTSIIKHRLKHTNAYKFKCDKCDKAFHRKPLLDLHLLSHVPKEEQPFMCCKCARRFHSEALLRQHQRVHLPKEERLIYPCSVCLKKFSSKAAVTYHLKAVHSGERPFICDQCGHSFTSKGILQEHLTIHSDETPFKCAQCQKSFKTKYRLKIHMDTHREIPYQCPVCPLQLSTRRTLRMHLVVHRDTRAYQCATCGKAFRRAKDLKNHHNLHTGSRPYTCTFCPRTFANGSNCRAHKRKMHPEELRIYEAALAAAENDGSANPASVAHNAVKMAAANKKSSEEQKPPTDDHLEHSPDELQTSSIIEKHSIFGSSVESCNLLATRRVDSDMYTDHLQVDIKYLDNSVNVSESCAASVSEHLHSVPNIDLTANMNHSLLANRNQQLYNRLGHNSLPSLSEACNSVDLNTSRCNEQLVNNSHISPLNLNVAEMHSLNRHQHNNPEVEESSYLSRDYVGSVNRHHMPNLNSNIQLHRQQQHQSLTALNNRMHQQAEELHSYATFYQHHADSMPSAVAAAIAHSRTMGVPAFPGNPYVHHNMGYSRGTSNM